MRYVDLLRLRNTLLFMLGISIPVVISFVCILIAEKAWLSVAVVPMLWAYVVTLFADGYFSIKEGSEL